MSMMTLSQWREARRMMTATDLLDRCKSAARLEMRGGMYSSDDRLECAAQIMADGVAEVGGALPTINDPRHTLNAYCGRAKNYRRSIDRRRARDDADAQAAADARAWTLDALMPDYVSDPEPTSPADARQAADHAVKRLGLRGSNVLSLFYGYARDLPGPVVADELKISANAYDVRCLRGKAEVRKSYPTAGDFLAALVGQPIESIDPLTGETVLRYVLTDASREAHTRTHLLSQGWREGTDAGRWASRPETIESARAVCDVRWRRAAPTTSAKARARALRNTTREHVEADSLLRLSRALSAQR